MKKKQHILPPRVLSAYRKQRPAENKKLPVCLAPFKSLRFLPDGNITVCCHNNSFSLGKYPGISIQQAWGSGQMKLFRKKISSADFSVGCNKCFFAFINGNFNTVNPKLYENYSLNHDFPVILDFKIATECNLECMMCSEYSSSAIRHISQNYEASAVIYNDEFVCELVSFVPYIKEARFSGGEPFLNNIYYKIWELIIEKNPECRISVQTNGTILNKRIKEILEKGRFFLNISIDAVKPESYRNIRVNGEINQVLKNLEYFSQYSNSKNYKLGITACAMKDNIQDLPDVLSLANEYHAYLWYSEVHFPFINALHTMSGNDLEKAACFLRSCIPDENSEIQKHNAGVYYYLIKRIEFLQAEACTRESGKGLIAAPVLKKILKKNFENNIKENPRVWNKIETIFDSFGNRRMIDISQNTEDAYDAAFIYSHLGRISNAALYENFMHLIIAG